MKIILTFLTAALLLGLTANGQNYFFIGERSFPCTESFILKSNSKKPYVNDLIVRFGKDGAKGIILVSIKTVSTVRISGKLNIYLDDGTVISCIDRGINDNVDDIASSAYQLTREELLKLKNSNINSIRYTVKCIECFGPILAEGNFTASNIETSKTDFPALVAHFFNN